MKYTALISPIYLIGFATSLVGVTMKLMHYEWAEIPLIISIFFNLTFIVLSIYEVRTSDRYSFRGKTMWTIALIFLSGIAGLVYVIKRNNRLVARSSM